MKNCAYLRKFKLPTLSSIQAVKLSNKKQQNYNLLLDIYIYYSFVLLFPLLNIILNFECRKGKNRA